MSSIHIAALPERLPTASVGNACRVALVEEEEKITRPSTRTVHVRSLTRLV